MRLGSGRTGAPSMVGMLTMLAVSGCVVGERRDGSVEPGTAEMAGRQRQIYERALADPLPYFHLNRRRVELWREGLEQTPMAQAPEARCIFAHELLNAGGVETFGPQERGGKHESPHDPVDRESDVVSGPRPQRATPSRNVAYMDAIRSGGATRASRRRTTSRPRRLP